MFFPNSCFYMSRTYFIELSFPKQKINLEFRYINKIIGYQLNSLDYWIIAVKELYYQLV